MKRAAKSKTGGRDEVRQVKDYLAKLPADARAGLNKLRKAILTALPDAELGISYGMPAFRLNGRPVVWFAGFKNHCSLFPGAAAIRIHRDELAKYPTSKGTVQFPPDAPLPARLVARLVKTRMAEMEKRTG